MNDQPAELGDPGADLDRARPVQLLHEVDLHAHQHVGHAGGADAERLVAKHRHPAALEIGREHRLVDVALRVEVAEAADVADAVRVVGKLSGTGLRGLGVGWSFKGKVLRVGTHSGALRPQARGGNASVGPAFCTLCPLFATFDAR